MSIIGFVEKNLNQTVVYWAYAGPDGYGGATYSSPVELGVRWENVNELVQTGTGEEVVSRARVWTSQDLVEQSLIYLGTMDDSDYNEDSSQMEGLMTVLAFVKIPVLGSSTKFLRRAHLNMSRRSAV